MRLAFIGGGVMGEAMVRCILSKGVTNSEDIVVSDIAPQRRKVLTEKYNVRVTDANPTAVDDADVVVLAVKPQELNKVVAELRGLLAGQLVLSIVAGVSLDSLRHGLHYGRLARAMPNMPAQIGEGITVWTAASDVTETQKGAIKSILGAMGEEIYVDNEKYIDMATALSGSGPAYVFLIVEALVDAGVHIGLPRQLSEKLVIKTVLGSARAVELTGKHPAELKNMVTSPGGTTAEGLLELEKGGIRSLLSQAVIAAYEKARSLAGK
jgi:pyrroline-5-carboxylate reductase